jgi:putative phosphoribosyl transferase
MGPIFQDRLDAGRYLARHLAHHSSTSDLTVLALARGGVPVGYEVARALKASLDVFMVRKLGVPGVEEMAFGAIASGGVKVINQEMVHRLAIPQSVVDAIVAEQEAELDRREKAYRGGREPVPVQGRALVLVDDGLATGASLRAAARALRERKPSQLIVAVPVGSLSACEQLRQEVDELICPETPDPFFSIGTWYSNFIQLTDQEVHELLERSARERNPSRARDSQTAIKE